MPAAWPAVNTSRELGAGAWLLDKVLWQLATLVICNFQWALVQLQWLQSAGPMTYVSSTRKHAETVEYNQCARITLVSSLRFRDRRSTDIVIGALITAIFLIAYPELVSDTQSTYQTRNCLVQAISVTRCQVGLLDKLVAPCDVRSRPRPRAVPVGPPPRGRQQRRLQAARKL